MDPRDQIAAIRSIEAQGWDIIGIYHSHPSGPATPSPTDIANASYDVVYVIVSLANLPHLEMRGYRILGEEAKEIGIVVEDQKSRNEEAVRLIEEWMRDTTGYDEEAWGKIQSILY